MNQESEYRGCLRVLCLEDSPVDAELAGEVLAGAGYELEMDVATPDEAREMLGLRPR